jgi:hypothetical protein
MLQVKPQANGELALNRQSIGVACLDGLSDF